MLGQATGAGKVILSAAGGSEKIASLQELDKVIYPWPVNLLPKLYNAMFDFCHDQLSYTF